jgi:hypothetical protein
MRRLVYFVPVVLALAVAYLLFGPAVLQSREPPAKLHRLVLQVNSDEPAMMNLVLNNANNVEQYYSRAVNR